MTIKSFKEFSEAIAADLKPNKQADDETKSLEPRAQGEKDFKAAHKAEKKDHPVAGDHQFNGDRKEVKS